MSNLYERYKALYDRGWCTKEQIRRIVEIGRLTPEEYESITGEPYETSDSN